jgi:hypothetical protein
MTRTLYTDIFTNWTLKGFTIWKVEREGGREREEREGGRERAKERLRERTRETLRENQRDSKRDALH